ncbi:ParA family protein, partial [Clostridium tarantellae]|nr:ParA family protein [Clostridium tarantellae]
YRVYTSVLIPLEPSMFNLQGLSQLVKVFKLIQRNYNKSLKVEGVLLTRVDARTTLTGDFKEELKDIFADKLFNVIIHQNAAIVRAQIEGKPVLYYDKRSKGAEEYMLLAKEVIKRA